MKNIYTVALIQKVEINVGAYNEQEALEKANRYIKEVSIEPKTIGYSIKEFSEEKME